MARGMRARKQHAQIWSAILSSLVLGMFFGSVGSLLVNCALVEISLSPLFATAFGVLFLISGGTVAWQVLHGLIEPDSRKEMIAHLRGGDEKGDAAGEGDTPPWNVYSRSIF